MVNKYALQSKARFVRTCNRKARYRTLEAAWNQANRMHAAHGNWRFSAYVCPICKGYHVGRTGSVI